MVGSTEDVGVVESEVDGSQTAALINLGYSVFLIFWTVLFLETWKRKQSAYVVEWGTEGCEES